MVHFMALQDVLFDFSYYSYWERLKNIENVIIDKLSKVRSL